jgi:3-hydroxyisobutyrate dehydrogenase-like beta-hydroxyacid dehydrogenase
MEHARSDEKGRRLVVSRAIERVGFIGVGNQGAPMARHIIEAGFPTTLWARRPDSLEQFADLKFDTTTTAAELGRTCDIVGICVWDDDGVTDVLLGDDGVFAGMRPGGTVAIHSTISPDTVHSMGEEAAARGINLLDAPVSGDRPTNEAGELLVMVGGDAEVAERSRPIFLAFGGVVVYLGPLGSGTLAKLVNNVLLASIMAVTKEALDLGQEYGLDRDELITALANGSAAKGAAMAMQSYQGYIQHAAGSGSHLPRVVGSWARKDVELAIGAARKMGIDTDRDIMTLGLRAAAILEERYASRTQGQ